MLRRITNNRRMGVSIGSNRGHAGDSGEGRRLIDLIAELFGTMLATKGKS